MVTRIKTNKKLKHSKNHKLNLELKTKCYNEHKNETQILKEY